MKFRLDLHNGVSRKLNKITSGFSQLNKSFATTKTKISGVNTKLNSIPAEKTKNRIRKINNQKFNRLQREIKQTSRSLRKVSSYASRSRRNLRKTGKQKLSILNRALKKTKKNFQQLSGSVNKFGNKLKGLKNKTQNAFRSKAVKKYGNEAQKTGKKLDKLNQKAKRAKGGIGSLKGAFIGAAAVFGATRFISSSLDAWNTQEKAIAQVKIGLQTTGNVAGRTLKQLEAQASSLQNKTLFGDEEILQGSTAQLLTFTNIAGKQFDRTQMMALNSELVISNVFTF